MTNLKENFRDILYNLFFLETLRDRSHLATMKQNFYVISKWVAFLPLLLFKHKDKKVTKNIIVVKCERTLSCDKNAKKLGYWYRITFQLFHSVLTLLQMDLESVWATTVRGARQETTRTALTKL